MTGSFRSSAVVAATAAVLAGSVNCGRGNDGARRASASASLIPAKDAKSAAESAIAPGSTETTPREWSPCVARSIASDPEPATWVRKATRELVEAPDDVVARRALTDLGGALSSVQSADTRGLSLALVAEALVAKGDRDSGVRLAEGAETAAKQTSTGITLDRAEALRHLAAVYASIGQHDRAHKLAGDDVEARATVAGAYAASGDTLRADKILLEIGAHTPKTPAGQLALVDALASRGKIEEARIAAGRMLKDRDIALAHIVERAPATTPTRVLFGIADMAIASADNSAETWDHRVRVYLTVARALARLGDKTKADALRDRAAEWARENAGAPGAADVFAQIATDAADGGDVDGALGTLERLGHPPLTAIGPNPLARVLVLTRGHRFEDALGAARDVTIGEAYAILVIAARSDARRKNRSLEEQLSALACPG